VFDGTTLSLVKNSGNNKLIISARAFVNATIENLDIKNVKSI
jgi:hypothetical protein